MYRQSWVATTEPDYVVAGAIPLVTNRENLQKLVDGFPEAEIDAIMRQKIYANLPEKEKGQVRQLLKGVNNTERDRLKTLGLLDQNGKITPYRITQEYLDNLYSPQSWERLFHVPGGKITEKGLRYAIYMAAEYMFQQIQGNNAAAIDDYLTGNRLMNDFATYEIFWHWLWTAIHHEVNYEVADGTIQKLTWDTMKRFLDEHSANSEKKINALIAEDRFTYDRRWSPIVMKLLERQLKHKRWIQYGSRVLLSVIERSDEEREQILDAVFSASREDVTAKINAGESPKSVLQAYDYVYDIFPESTAERDSAVQSVVSAL